MTMACGACVSVFRLTSVQKDEWASFTDRIRALRRTKHSNYDPNNRKNLPFLTRQTKSRKTASRRASKTTGYGLQTWKWSTGDATQTATQQTTAKSTSNHHKSIPQRHATASAVVGADVETEAADAELTHARYDSISYHVLGLLLKQHRRCRSRSVSWAKEQQWRRPIPRRQQHRHSQ